MRIGVDGTCWANNRGYGRFTRELCTALATAAGDCELVFFHDERSAAAFDLSAPNVRGVVVPLGASPTQAASAGGSRSPFDMIRMSRAVARQRPDVFFSPSVYTFFPLPRGLPAVVTVHDTIAERHPELTLPTRRARLFWRAKVWLALRQARLVLTVSDFSARDIEEVLGVARDRIRVAGEAPSPAYAPGDGAGARAAAGRAGVAAGARWFVYVGGINPHKHVDLLVEAHASLPVEGAGTYLVLVGPSADDAFHADLAGVRAAIERAGTGARVLLPGYLPDEELRQLHTGAIALVLPSEREGFGLPAVEAAACGTPVVATTHSPLPELLEGGGIFVRPGDVAALADAMRTMMDDEPLRERLGRRALEAAGRLSWPAAAEAALASLREASA